ncbi:LysM peptidoglycan-binding domain-containing protein, partial [Bacillus cereus]|uniref:LysM peptidoglycan-binding domain-containing protein n=1 Tax=Bacillus cereus TaxID=1396 RepID=UPI000A3F526E
MKTTTNTTITAKDMTFEGMAPNKPRSSVHKDKEADWGFVYDAKRQDRIENAKNLGTKDGLKGKGINMPTFGSPKRFVAAALATGIMVGSMQSPVFADADLEYTATAGESLESIAKDHGIGVDQLISGNEEDVIKNFHDGSTLRVPDNSYKLNRENAEKYYKENPELYKDGMPKTLTKEMQEKLSVGKPAYQEQGVEIQEEKQQPVAP